MSLLAVVLADDNVLAYVYQTAGKIARVGRAQRRIRQTFAGAVRGDEEVQNGQSLAEISLNGDFYCASRRVGHKAAHACKLSDLVFISAGARFNHHVDGVKIVKGSHQCVKHVLGRLLPDGYNIAVALVVRGQAAAVFAVNKSYFILRLFYKRLLFSGHNRVLNTHGNGALSGVIKAQTLNAVQHLGSARRAMAGKASGNNLPQLGFAH